MVVATVKSARRLHVLIACHNRRQLTVRAVKSLLTSTYAAGIKTKIIVFDDGSSDGTAAAVLKECPEAKILVGDGSAFWAKSMSTAEAYVLHALDPQQGDLLLWLNDDVDLRLGAIESLLDTHEMHPHAVVVGAVCDPKSATMTYSGFRRYGRHALHLRKIMPTSAPMNVDSFNGNVVLVPVPVAMKVGGIDGSYSHAWADLDYGFRCQQAKIPMVLAPGFAGTCSANSPRPRRDILTEWKEFLGPKGPGNMRSLQKILQRQSKILWLPQFAATYVLWWLRALCRLISTRKIHSS